MLARLILAIVVSVGMSYGGYKKKSLNQSGALAALFVGFFCMLASIRFGVLLLAFFITSSKITKVGSSKKKQLEADFKEGGQRNWVQVMANGGFGLLLALLFMIFVGADDLPVDYIHHPLASYLLCAYLGFFACCAGDTWSSELGILSRSPPRLITTGRVVPPGTNGGLSLLGVLASAAGGLCMGVVYVLCNTAVASKDSHSPAQWPLVLLGLLSGLVGSLLDSLMGATIQYSALDLATNKVVSQPSPNTKHISGMDLVDNHMVNFLSAVITGLVTGVMGALVVV